MNANAEAVPSLPASFATAHKLYDYQALMNKKYFEVVFLKLSDALGDGIRKLSCLESKQQPLKKSKL